MWEPPWQIGRKQTAGESRALCGQTVQLGPSSAIGIERALPPAAFSAALPTARGTATASLLLCSAVAGCFCPIQWCRCHLLRVERTVLRGSALQGAPGNECLRIPAWHPRALGQAHPCPCGASCLGLLPTWH